MALVQSDPPPRSRHWSWNARSLHVLYLGGGYLRWKNNCLYASRYDRTVKIYLQTHMWQFNSMKIVGPPLAPLDAGSNASLKHVLYLGGGYWRWFRKNNCSYASRYDRTVQIYLQRHRCDSLTVWKWSKDTYANSCGSRAIAILQDGDVGWGEKDGQVIYNKKSIMRYDRTVKIYLQTIQFDSMQMVNWYLR